MTMQTRNIPKATVFVILGGGGDLTWRKLIPALYNFFLRSWISRAFRCSGAGPRRDER